MGTEDPDPTTIDVGQAVFDDDGNRLGNVRGITEDGFMVATSDGIQALSVEHERAEPDSGHAELMWRCASCGEMGDIEALPDRCPECGAPAEDIYYYVDD